MPEVLGHEVHPIGLGLMGYTWVDKPQPVEESVEALRAAVKAGSNFWNGASFYGPPSYNSLTLLNAYFTKYPEDAEKVFIVIKGGFDVASHGPSGDPDFIRRDIDGILKQLDGKKKLDVYCIARRDPKVPFETTLNVIQKEYVDTGKVGGIGISEVRAESIHEAVKHVKIATCEVELSMFTPDILKNGVADACAQYNIPISAYSPIGRGILSGKLREVSDYANKGRVTSLPRFQEDTLKHNLQLVDQVEALAKKKGCSAAQLAIAWVSSLSGKDGHPVIVPIPGSTKAARLEENIASAKVQLTKEDLDEIWTVVTEFKPAGGRYAEGAPVNT